MKREYNLQLDKEYDYEPEIHEKDNLLTEKLKNFLTEILEMLKYA